jgi:hypothetical protein
MYYFLALSLFAMVFGQAHEEPAPAPDAPVELTDKYQDDLV